MVCLTFLFGFVLLVSIEGMRTYTILIYEHLERLDLLIYNA